MRLYLDDPYLAQFEATVEASGEGWCRLSRTAFYPGGGGQPADRGVLGGRAVTALREDDGGRLWHEVGVDLAPGSVIAGAIDWPFRYALMRAHALMHVVNTVARERLGGAMTGVQLGDDRSRIDFRLAGFGREQIPRLEEWVNDVIARDLPVSSAVITEDEFRARPSLIRTLHVLPPIIEGRVRVVEIAGFDVQACGGTHVHRTGEIGRARLARFDNKGRENKRFYWELEQTQPL